MGPDRQALADDLKSLAVLEGPALVAIWTLLGPSLAERVPDAVGEELERFCRTRAVDPETIARGIRGWRFVLRQAFVEGTTAGAVVSSVARAVGEEPPPAWIVALIEAGFEPAMVQLRREASQRAVTDHGPVLTGSSWRLDTIEVSDRGSANLKIGFLTLRMRQGDREESVTLQVSRESAAELEDALRRLSSALGADPSR